MEKNPHQWQRLRSEPGPKMKLFSARFDEMKNPRNGAVEKMIVLETDDASNIVALTPDREILFVRQYRFGIGYETVELPGGIVDAGENPLLGAKRELEEETGYTGLLWSYLGKVPANPVFMDSYIHHWLLLDANPGGTVKLDDGETIELLRMPVEEVRRKLYEGYFQHPHTVNGLVLFFGTTNGSTG